MYNYGEWYTRALYCTIGPVFRQKLVIVKLVLKRRQFGIMNIHILL